MKRKKTFVALAMALVAALWLGLSPAGVAQAAGDPTFSFSCDRPGSPGNRWIVVSTGDTQVDYASLVINAELAGEGSSILGERWFAIETPAPTYYVTIYTMSDTIIEGIVVDTCSTPPPTYYTATTPDCIPPGGSGAVLVTVAAGAPDLRVSWHVTAGDNSHGVSAGEEFTVYFDAATAKDGITIVLDSERRVALGTIPVTICTSPLPSPVAPAPTPQVSDTTPQVGDVLQANPGTWGPDPVQLTFQWFRDDAVIPGATTAQYVVQAVDVGSSLQVQVTGSKTGYVSVVKSSAPTAAVLAGALTSTPVPTVSDAAPVGGQTLTANPATWSPAPVQLTFQWFRDAAAIPGATTAQYAVQAADVGSSLKVQVTGSKTGYVSVSKTSAATGVVAKGVVSPTPTPRISDTTPVTDQVLTAQSGTWGPSGVILKYQWYRRSTSGKVKAISGATRDTYQVRASDVGYRLRVNVTGSLPSAKSVAKMSAWTSKVAKANFIAAPSPTVSGVVQVGTPLTLVAGTWAPTAKLKYQWYRVANSGKRTTIRKATKAAYTPKAADKGRRLQVRVTAERSGYVTTARYSPNTIKVA